MEKVSIGITNTFCPQPLYLFGTYDEGGQPNYGLMGWLTYFSSDALHIVTCLGGEKLTRDRMRSDKLFSVNLVTQSMLPVSDYYGNVSGYDPKKRSVTIETIPGRVLNVPIAKESPWSFEVEVEQVQPYGFSDLFICKVHNVMAFAELIDESRSMEERMQIASPVVTVGHYYFSLNPAPLGSWGDWKEIISPR